MMNLEEINLAIIIDTMRVQKSIRIREELIKKINDNKKSLAQLNKTYEGDLK